jgi:hypothetical protein
MIFQLIGGSSNGMSIDVDLQYDADGYPIIPQVIALPDASDYQSDQLVEYTPGMSVKTEYYEWIPNGPGKYQGVYAWTPRINTSNEK